MTKFPPEVLSWYLVPGTRYHRTIFWCPVLGTTRYQVQNLVLLSITKFLPAAGVQTSAPGSKVLLQQYGAAVIDRAEPI